MLSEEKKKERRNEKARIAYHRNRERERKKNKLYYYNNKEKESKRKIGRAHV